MDRKKTNSDLVDTLKELISLRGPSFQELDSILRTLAIYGPRKTIHTRFAGHKQCIAYAAMYAGNVLEPKYKTGYDSHAVDVFLYEFAIALISEGGQSRKEIIELAKAIAEGAMNLQKQIKDQMGDLIKR